MGKTSVLPFVTRSGTDAAAGKWHKEEGQSRAGKRAQRRLWKRIGQAVATQQWTMLTIGMGLLLGRAELVEHMAPFAAAFFSVILYLRKDLAVWAAAALIAGSFWSVNPQPAVIAGELCVIFLLFRGLVKYEKADLSHAPIVAFAAVLMVELFDAVLMDEPGWLPYLWTAASAGLALVLAILFIHTLGLAGRKKRLSQIKQEEWVGIFILLACLLVGTTGWSVRDVNIAEVLTRFIVLAAAFIGGPATGALAGVIAGMMLTLSDLTAVDQVGLLAFGGLLAGLIREGGKAASVFGLLLGTSVLTLITADAGTALSSSWATIAAMLLFFVTPRRWLDSLSSYVPGTVHYAHHQREYAKKVRDLTAERVARFSEVFRQLSGSFRQLTEAGDQARQHRDYDHFVSAVQNKSCFTCHKRGWCWDDHFMQSYKLMTTMMSAIADKPDMAAAEIPKGWTRHCVKTPQVLDILRREFEMYQHDMHWRQQLQDSRYLVADQLSGVSQVMDDLVKEIKREARQMEHQENQIREAIGHLGLAVQHIEIISLDEGRMEIELVHAFRSGYDECRKMIAPLLSEIVGETISVRQEKVGAPAAHLTTVVFGSAKLYEVETGVAGSAKDGDLLSGDSFTMTELGNGKFAVALSDGMGNGARARMESSAALSMLEQLLQSGIDERLAIKSVNSVLLLRSPEEMFATVDLALIDLYGAHATLLKIGSTPSFIKRGDDVIPIAASNLPIGILQEIEIDLLQVQLQAGDTLVMMTDGVLDAATYAVNKEMWMKRVLQEIDTDDPQEMAEQLLQTAIKESAAVIRDDMTVIVARIYKHQPQWAAFRYPGLGRVDRPRTVS